MKVTKNVEKKDGNRLLHGEKRRPRFFFYGGICDEKGTPVEKTLGYLKIFLPCGTILHAAWWTVVRHEGIKHQKMETNKKLSSFCPFPHERQGRGLKGPPTVPGCPSSMDTAVASYARLWRKKNETTKEETIR